MPEEKKQQVGRIAAVMDGLDPNKQEAALAFMQGMAAGAKMTEKQTGETHRSDI